MKKQSFLPLLSKAESLYQGFHGATSLVKLSEKTVPVSNWPASWKKVFYKEYPRFKTVLLPESGNKYDDSLVQVLQKRESLRKFSSKKMDLDELSFLLHYAAGVNLQRKNDDYAPRFYPSAGGRYPNEIYLVPSKINGLSRFSYHFNVKRGYLEKLFSFNSYSEIVQTITNQNWIEDASAVVCISAVFDRTIVKYGDRGYRYCFLDAGHLAQNIYLLSTAMGLKCCAIGGFNDLAINIHLGLEDSDEKIIYLLAIGK